MPLVCSLCAVGECGRDSLTGSMDASISRSIAKCLRVPASLQDHTPPSIAHHPTFAAAHACVLSLPFSHTTAPCGISPYQVVDDEVVEELLKEVARALVEADVNIKVRMSRGGGGQRSAALRCTGRGGGVASVCGSLECVPQPCALAARSTTTTRTRHATTATARTQVVAALRKAIKEKADVADAAAGMSMHLSCVVAMWCGNWLDACGWVGVYPLLP